MNKGGMNLHMELKRWKARTNSGWKEHNFDDTERISKTTAVSGDAGQS